MSESFSARARLLLPAGAVAFVVVVAVGAAARLWAPEGLFVDGVLLPISNDAAYHARRILRLTADFRYPGLFDPLFDWPRGAATHWSPGFDFIAAACAIAFGGADDAERAARVAAYLPAVYGIAAVVVVGALARRVAPREDTYSAATAAAFVAFVPQSLGVSRVGFVDHHVTELLSTALLLRWVLSSTELAETGAPRARRLRFEAEGTLLVAASVWVQSVALLYVGIAAAALSALQLVRRSPGERPSRSLVGSGAPALAAGAALLGALYVPAVREHGRTFAYEYPSYFQPALIGYAGAFVAAATLVAARIRRPRIGLARAATWLALWALGMGAAAAALYLLVPSARGAVMGIAQFAATEGADLGKIDELQPLFGAPGALDGSRWDRVDGYFGWTGRALLLLVPVGLVAARRLGPERFATIVSFTCALVGLSLFQNRWSRALVVPVALVSALSLHHLARLAARKLGGGAADRALEHSPKAAFAMALSLLLAPDPLGALAPEAQQAGSVMEAGLFLRQQGRPAEPGRRAGLLASWQHGFQLLHTSRMPLLSTGHAWLVGEEGYRLERAAWSGSAEALWKLLDTRDLGFVVAGAENLTTVSTSRGPRSLLLQPGSPRIDWRYFEEVPLGVMVLGGSGLPAIGVRHLEHLCPRFAGSEFAPVEVPLPRLWVFERVEGAVLEGSAAPSARVVAEIRLRHAAGIVSYFAWADADPAGSFAIRFPIPTAMATSTLRSSKSVRVQRPGLPETALELPEAAVLSGERVSVPWPEGAPR